MFSRGFSKFNLKNYEEAIKDFDKAIEIDPQQSGSWSMRGLTYLRTIRYELAEKDFKNFIKDIPYRFSRMSKYVNAVSQLSII